MLFHLIHTMCFFPSLVLHFFSFHLHCSPFSFQRCEQGKKLKRIHWVANIGTALNFLEGRKVRVQRRLFMFFSLVSVLPLPLLSLLSCCLVGTSIESWPCVTCFPFVPASYSLHLPTSLIYPENNTLYFYVPLQRFWKLDIQTFFLQHSSYFCCLC